MSNSNMTPEQAAEVLRYLNEWRRCAEGEQPDPKTIGIAIDTAIECMSAPTPTDEQIGKLFDQHTDVSVLLNPISPTHAMTRTAAIQFAKALFGQFKSES